MMREFAQQRGRIAYEIAAMSSMDAVSKIEYLSSN
jgi:hypothetical protein